MLTQAENVETATQAAPSLFQRALRIEWLGQMLASIFWIVSVFIYNEYGTGDIFQLMAACAWFVANVAALFSPK